MFGNNWVIREFGYCCYSFEQFKDDNEIYALIWNLYIYSKYRRQGYAKLILQEIINKIKNINNTCDIYIEAIPQEDSINLNNLISFYESLGLQVFTNQ